MWEKFPRYNTMTDVFVSAEYIIPCYAEAFNCKKEIIRPLGVPRTDVFFDEEFVASGRSRLVEAIPSIGNRKIILYAPTFRGNSPTDAHNDDVIDFGKFRQAMGDEYVLVLKYHPFTNGADTFTDKHQSLYGDSIFLCPKEIGIDTAMCAADILISDYSSLVFEYSLLQRPMIFFAYDLEEYDTARSYYYDYRSFVPGPIASTDDEVIDYILNGTDMSKVQTFREKFMSACDGNSAKRITEYTINN
jgi:CDP-glycerol glycerophosphotransferase (TagB/SpsB family)